MNIEDGLVAIYSVEENIAGLKYLLSNFNKAVDTPFVPAVDNEEDFVSEVIRINSRRRFSGGPEADLHLAVSSHLTHFEYTSVSGTMLVLTIHRDKDQTAVKYHATVWLPADRVGSDRGAYNALTKVYLWNEEASYYEANGLPVPNWMSLKADEAGFVEHAGNLGYQPIESPLGLYWAHPVFGTMALAEDVGVVLCLPGHHRNWIATSKFLSIGISDLFKMLEADEQTDAVYPAEGEYDDDENDDLIDRYLLEDREDEASLRF